VAKNPKRPVAAKKKVTVRKSVKKGATAPKRSIARAPARKAASGKELTKRAKTVIRKLARRVERIAK